MAKVVKKSSVSRLFEEEDVLSTEILKSVDIDDDFVWVEKTSPEVMLQEDNLNSNCEIGAESINVVQQDTNIENSGSREEGHIQCDTVDTIIPTEWDRELLVEQQYWEQYGPVVQRQNNSRPKYPASQRLTVKQLNNIANGKMINRDPTYFKFDISTTSILKTLIDKKYVYSYHNVLGNGNSSVVIHANPEGYDNHGVAVKIYKLSNDVKRNNLIFKRAQREYAHLLLLRYHCRVPYVTHLMKNVIVFSFFGIDQEPFGSISSLPSEYLKDLYDILVREMNTWYTKFNLVHGKLCTKNILFDVYIDNYWVTYHHLSTPCRPHIIGWGHSVRRDHPQAQMKLMRDCHFVTHFFKRRGVPVKTTEELFKFITGLRKISSKVLDVINKKDLWQEGHLTNPNRHHPEGHQHYRTLRNCSLIEA